MTKSWFKKNADVLIKYVAPLLTAAGILVGGAWRMETHFAKAADVDKRISETKILFLDNQMRFLEKEQYELESVVEQGVELTKREKGRLDAVKKNIERIKDQIKVLENK